MESYLGSCLCERVSYQLLSSPKAVTHCHCKQCQKGHGAAFATYGAVLRKDLRIVVGNEAIQSFASSETVLR
ncbi:GFA family protein, partial [Alcaligenaceae bacterium 429]